MNAPAAHAHWQCPPKTIVVGVDFGEASARALGIARFLASAFQARLRALHAERFEPPPYFTIEQITALESERRTAQAATADHLARFAAASAFQVESLVVDEPPVEAILDASAGADLIVLGTHGRRGPGTLVARLGGRAGRARRRHSRAPRIVHPVGSESRRGSVMNVEQSLRLIAGGFVAASVLLGVYVNPNFHWFTLFVGLNLFQSAFTGWCPMMAILRKAGVQG